MATDCNIVIELLEEEIGGQITFNPTLLESSSCSVINNFETPSIILEKKFMCIEHKWDSQPNKLGKYLLDNYIDRNRILRMMCGGNMRSIIDVIMPYTAMKGLIAEPWYLNKPKFFHNEADINFQTLKGCYIYLFKNNQWLVKKNTFSALENDWQQVKVLI